MTCHIKIIVAAVVVFYGGFRVANALDNPEECQGQRFCDIKPPGYDDIQDDIDNKFWPIHEKWNLNDDKYEEDDRDDEYFKRYTQAEGFDDDSNCKIETSVMTPYTVTSNNTVMAIVQTDYYKQKIRMTKCAKSDEFSTEDDTCFMDMTQNGRCRTKEIYINLYVYNNNNIERISAPIDVCCVCSISH